MLIWFADNLGSSDTIYIEFREGHQQKQLPLESALRRFEEFNQTSQRRILAGLDVHFNLSVLLN